MGKSEIARIFADSSDQMTDDERGAAHAVGQKVDHIPYSLLGNEEAFANLYGYTTAQWRDDPKAHIDIMGMAPSLHICGKTSPLWEDMLDMKISAFSVDNCESLQGAKECLGDTFPLMGNVAPVDTMLNGTIDDVIENVKDCLHKGADSARGYTLDTGCQVPIGTPRENFQAYIYATRTYGRGAKLGCLPEGLDDKRRGQESELILQGC